MDKRLSLGLFALAVALVATLSFLAGSGVGFALTTSIPSAPETPPPSEPTKLEDALGVFWEAWKIVEDEFYLQPVDTQELTYGAIQGAIETLGDPNTLFVPPSHRFLFEDLDGSFEGIGAVVDLNEEGYLVIIEPLAGRPADLAGLKAGDVVLEVDGTPVKGMTLWEIISLIRGPEGTPVTLTVQREGVAEPFAVDIVRQRIRIETVEYEVLEGDIAYLKINEFNSIAHQEVRVALVDLLAQNPDLSGLILDLRDNPGGLVTSVEEIGDEFLEKGILFYEEGREEGREDHPLSGGGLAEDIPLVVLINQGSASASEILAGAVQDYGRGVLIGERTFGKGSVQLEHNLSDGSGLRLTIAHWYTPLGRQIDGQGLDPNLLIERTAEDEEAGRDPQLQAAVEYLLDHVFQTAE